MLVLAACIHSSRSAVSLLKLNWEAREARVAEWWQWGLPHLWSRVPSVRLPDVASRDLSFLFVASMFFPSGYCSFSVSWSHNQFKCLLHTYTLTTLTCTLHNWAIVLQGRVMSYSNVFLLTATKCTVQPVSVTPASSTCLWASTPLNEGSSEGWMLRSLPVHFRTNSPVNICIKPARQTSSIRNSVGLYVQPYQNLILTWSFYDWLPGEITVVTTITIGA